MTAASVRDFGHLHKNPGGRNGALEGRDPVNVRWTDGVDVCGAPLAPPPCAQPGGPAGYRRLASAGLFASSPATPNPVGVPVANVVSPRATLQTGRGPAGWRDHHA